jgi:integrase
MSAKPSALQFGRLIPSYTGARRGETSTFDVRAGVPVHVVAARLGHADPSIMLRVYAHLIGDQLAEAAAIFARAIEAG